MINTEKPPLGIAPGFIYYQDRINGLSQAIEKASDTKNIRIWANEIVALCDLIDGIGANQNE